MYGGQGGQNLKNDHVILRGGLRMMMVDDGGGRRVKNVRKSDDVINEWPLMKKLSHFRLKHI